MKWAALFVAGVIVGVEAVLFLAVVAMSAEEERREIEDLIRKAMPAYVADQPRRYGRRLG